MKEIKKMNKKVEDLFYDEYFRKEKGHSDWTDEQIAGSINQDDIADFVKWVASEIKSKYN